MKDTQIDIREFDQGYLVTSRQHEGNLWAPNEESLSRMVNDIGRWGWEVVYEGVGPDNQGV